MKLPSDWGAACAAPLGGGDLSDVAMWASLNAQCEHVTTRAAHHRWKFRVPFSLCRGKAVKQSNVCVDITVSVSP